MKRICFLLISFCLFVCHGFAQNFSLSLGPSLPIGEYANKDGNSQSSGLAKLGGLAEISYQHSLGGGRFGWIASLRGRLNELDGSASIQPLETEFPNFQWSTNHSYWTTAALLVGGYYRLPLTSSIDLLGYLQLGVAEAWVPKQSILGLRDSVGFGPTDLVEGRVLKDHATAFTGLGAVGVRYHLNRRWALMGRIGYWYLEPTFHNMTTTVIYAQHLAIPGIISLSNAEEITENTSARNYAQHMNDLDLSVGVGVTLK